MAFDCTVRLRKDPVQRKTKVVIGCGAGFAGDRPTAALKLLSRVHNLDYLVLECLAERTLAIRHDAMVNGGTGYDPRISEWMRVLLPEAVKNNVCIITNMGATDALGAQKEVFKIAEQYGLHITVGVAREVSVYGEGRKGSSTYLGASPIVKLLETSEPNVIITTRLADASLFLAPMVYELGWNWDDFEKLAQGVLAGHLLECGCQVTGGYYMHPADTHREMSPQQLLEVSLPYAEVSDKGEVVIAKLKGSGGELSIATCAQQLLYEVGDPSSYITPDLVVDFTQVSFEPLSLDKIIAKGALPGLSVRPNNYLRLVPQDCGWKAWGEISYGGTSCVERAKVAELLVLSWMEESFPEIRKAIMSYLIGMNSLVIFSIDEDVDKEREIPEVRLRMDGLFSSAQQAVRFTQEFEALYTNGPAGGGGISTGHKKEIFLEKVQVPREETFWEVSSRTADLSFSEVCLGGSKTGLGGTLLKERELEDGTLTLTSPPDIENVRSNITTLPTAGGVEVPLYHIAHSRAGDKGNDINFSLIPHCPADLPRLKSIITTEWVKRVVKELFSHLMLSSIPLIRSHLPNRFNGAREEVSSGCDVCVEIYAVQGISALNIVVRDALDGGVNCSRRLDRHGKSLSDLILSQVIMLPKDETISSV